MAVETTSVKAVPVSPINEIIRSIEEERSSKVIVYITGDRPSLLNGVELGASVAPDILPFFSEALESFGASTKKVTLVLYTNGGLIETPWPLVNLIRDYADEFEVIVLKKALSAGTLITLGADKIIMPKGSYLSPVDPATSIKDSNNTLKHIEIESIIGYIDFAKNKVGINDQATLGNMLSDLTKEINPSLIGSINRTHSLVRRLTVKLLDLHATKLPEHQVTRLAEHLTEKLFSHTHFISAREAIEIGFEDLIEKPSASLEQKLKRLYKQYQELMKLNEPLDPMNGASPDQPLDFNEECIRAVIHSDKVKYNFKTSLKIMSAQAGNEVQVNVNMGQNKWVKEK